MWNYGLYEAEIEKIKKCRDKDEETRCLEVNKPVLGSL